MPSSPAHKFRIGDLRATIWRTAEGGNWYSVLFSRIFKVEDGWRETENLGYEELLSSARLADVAHTWTMHQLAADARDRTQAERIVAK